MTREDILAEPPGRRLDSWVAEKVMGWERLSSGQVWNGPCDYVLKPYSTDISAACEVVEKVKCDGWSVTIQNWGGDDPYEVIFGFQEGPIRYSSVNLCEAICKASLLSTLEG